MVNFSDCYIAKVKSFLGFKSIDPLLPFAEFIQKNEKGLTSLIKNNQIIIFDAQGNEIDISLLDSYIDTAPEEIINTLSHQHDNKEKAKDEANNFREELDRIESINNEEKAKLDHKHRLTESLQGCDENYRLIMKKGIARTEVKIKALQEERQALLNLINRNTKNSKN